MFEGLETTFLSMHVVMLAAGAMVLMWAMRKIWHGMDDMLWVRRLKPLYPIVICQGAVWLPGILPEATMGERILVALWAAFLSTFSYQLFRRIIGNYGVKLPAKLDKVSYGPPKPPLEEKDSS